ncbi:MAG: hypothetical protein CMA07_05845 [Euryarchaeota archaeon]|jgi:hypothetical protein|nr:hypothetical protein [Euryarchaeota archaeon]|tara:strand:+ start:3202 stop:3654 length:453 start_codon:yes stop_codon:yes gene_type:complete
MKKKKIKGVWIGLVVLSSSVSASTIEHKFKSPSFSGINQSSHYLTIENQETSRKEAIKQELEDLQEQLERDAENTTLAKFIRNVESRIYSTLSRQIVDSMFGENPSTSGEFNIEGTGISYVTDGDVVILTVTDEDGSVTTITIPLGDFGI